MPTDLGRRALPATYFAPPYRARGEVLRQQVERAAADPLVDAILRAFGGVAVVLNRERQVVAFNGAYLQMLGLDRPSQALGLRLGEAVSCVHASDHPAGCGTGQACPSCGTAIAIALAQDLGRAEERECALAIRRGRETEDLCFRVRVHPLPVEGEELQLLTLTDVSLEKRRAGLERAFFHDVANLVAGLSCAAVSLRPEDPEDLRAVTADIRVIASRLARELEVQRLLSSAEALDYEPMMDAVDLGELVAELRAVLQYHPAAMGKRLAAPEGRLGTMTTDPHLLERVLTNMLVNAFEATARGDQVRLEVEEQPEQVTFRVWNPGAIAASIAPRIFQRYFSTKPGSGRGQGTFIMKLLGERVLGGEVGFTSSATGGTTFSLRLPRRPPPAPRADLP
jgi:signal transduction histidine kinase